MCSFCSNIPDDSSVGWMGDERVKNNLITYDTELKKFYIQVASGDPYETGILEDVKFCPYCGEKLSWKGDLNND